MTDHLPSNLIQRQSFHLKYVSIIDNFINQGTMICLEHKLFGFFLFQNFPYIFWKSKSECHFTSQKPRVQPQLQGMVFSYPIITQYLIESCPCPPCNTNYKKIRYVNFTICLKISLWLYCIRKFIMLLKLNSSTKI